MQMIACNREDIKWSEKKLGGDNGMKTVECLRGRLLAERQASKTANEDAQFMGNKLLELENKLKEETKLRNRAEKKLKLLKKKLESLKILPNLEESEQSSSSQNSAVTSVSYASSSSTKDPQELASMSQNTVPEISKNVEENASDTNTSIKSLEISSNEEKSDAKDSSYEKSSSKSDTSSSSFKASTNDSSFEKSSIKSNSSHEVVDNASSSSLKASTMEINKMNEDCDEDDDDSVVDNSLALVPMKLPENKEAPEVKIVSKSIGEVLENLRHARERIQSSMGRRQMIRVGPS